MNTDQLLPCCDCGGYPTIQECDLAGRFIKWFACKCGRKASPKLRACSTRAEAAKRWNKDMRFIQSYRARQGRAEREAK